MDRQMNIIKPNEMTKLLDKLNTMGFLLGLKNFWITDVDFSTRFVNLYSKFIYVIQILNSIFAMSILVSFFTQKNLTEKQASERLIYGLAVPGHLIFYYILSYYKEETRVLLYHLAVVLKERHNDANLEREMVKKLNAFTVALYGIAMTSNVVATVSALYQMIAAGENFIVVVTAWPDVYDNSTLAGVARLFISIWYVGPTTNLFMATLLLLVTMMVAMCYQFRNLQNYFYGLDDIFSDKTLSQAEKETKYEEAFKVGIQMHSLTLWCKNQHQHICKGIFAFEIILFFGMLLTQLISLLASKLSEAMYSSGWQNCYGKSSVRIRKLVVMAISQAQDPVVYKALGVLELSYATYVTLVKMPYSAVSVFY